MIANALLSFWPPPTDVETAPESSPNRRAPPLFIGDAVQPWAGETMLLTLLREEALRDRD